jgi:ribonuclease T1
MRRRKKTGKTGSAWMAAVAVALLAMFAWNAFRGPDDTRDATPGARTSQALELPPPMTGDGNAPSTAARYPDFLPAEAIDTLQLIERGGPYPYRQDDGVFGNRESRLPRQPRGYYREYTVKTPGSRDRGARRIVAGGRPPTEFFYTDDHYGSFRRFTLDGAAHGATLR